MGLNDAQENGKYLDLSQVYDGPSPYWVYGRPRSDVDLNNDQEDGKYMRQRVAQLEAAGYFIHPYPWHERINNPDWMNTCLEFSVVLEVDEGECGWYMGKGRDDESPAKALDMAIQEAVKELGRHQNVLAGFLPERYKAK